MAYNRALVAGASFGIGLAGDAAPKVFSHLSPACRLAVGNMAADSVIEQACGPGFTDVSLLWVFILGVVTFIVLNFGRDILQSLTQSDNPKPAY